MTETFAQVLIDHAPIAAFVVDSKWRLRHVNPKASPVFSRIDNLLERDFRDVLRILWPAPTADWVLEKFEHTTETGEPYFNPEFSEVRADLKERQFYDWQLHRITLPDGANGLVCYFSDISKHVQARQALEDSERLFHQLFDLMPQLGWTARPDGFVDFCNRGWYEYTGTTFEQMHAGSTREQMLGWGREAVHDPEIWPSVKEQWLRSMNTSTPFEMKFPLRGRDGKFRWFLTRVNPIKDVDGKLIRWVGINTDIQEEKERAEEMQQLVRERTIELVKARDEAIAASETKSRFLSTVSHEVRTPLAGVIGIVEMLQIMAQDEEQEQLAATALDSGKRCLEILNDLVDASRLNLGKLALEHRQFALRPIINDMVDLITPQAEKKNVRVVSEFSAAVPDYVYGDELRIRQVLHNLCFNAVKFTQSGEVRIAVGLVSNSEQQTTLKFTVSDTGIGISDEQKSRLFQPFEQAESSTSRVFGGTGLGLSIASTLCGLMGGEIGVESQLGKGSAFWIKLPFHEECRPVCMQTP